MMYTEVSVELWLALEEKITDQEFKWSSALRALWVATKHLTIAYYFSNLNTLFFILHMMPIIAPLF